MESEVPSHLGLPTVCAEFYLRHQLKNSINTAGPQPIFSEKPITFLVDGYFQYGAEKHGDKLTIGNE